MRVGIYAKAGTELIPALQTLLLIDQIYKAVHGRELHEEIDYGKKLKIGDHLFSIGKIANYYRSLVSKYGFLCKAVCSKDSLEMLSRG